MAKQVIICVDDEEIVLWSLKRELNEALGDEYLLETAESGEETLEVFQELVADGYEIPLVISDHIMLDMKGDELLQHIHAISPKTLKIMLTGQADLEAVTNAVNYANLYRYIAKPWEKTDLDLTVKEALRRYAQEKQLAEQHVILQNKNTILEQQVRERTAELKAANASKDKFFSIIAHDLRAPFTGLLGLTQLFLEHFDEFSPDDIKDSLQSLLMTVKTVYTLIENLLTWSRLQQGVMEYVPQEIALKKIVASNFSVFTPTAEQKQITLKNLIPDQILAYADHNMVHTVVRNLISNALKFTHAGGSIDVSARLAETSVEVAVADTGMGIPPKDLAKLFRIDVKYRNVGTAGEEGSGLGLIL